MKFQIGDRVIINQDIWSDDNPTGEIAGTATLVRPDDSITAGVDLVYCVRLDDRFQGKLIQAGSFVSVLLAQEHTLEAVHA